MYDVRGQELAARATETAEPVEAEANPEAARGQSAEVQPSAQELIEACRGASAATLPDLLRLAASVPRANVILLKAGRYEVDGKEVDPAGLYPEGAFWPKILELLVANADALDPAARADLATLAGTMPTAHRLIILEQVLGVPVAQGQGGKEFTGPELNALTAEAARLPAAHVESERGYLERVERNPNLPWYHGDKSHNISAASMRSQAAVARTLAGSAKRPELAGEEFDPTMKRAVVDAMASQYKAEDVDTPAKEYARAFRHEIGHAVDHQLRGSASGKLREEAGWQTTSVEDFVRACEPKATDVADAVALLQERFKGGPDLSTAVDKGEGDSQADWWERLEGLASRFPTLVDALKQSKYGKQLGRKAVRGGFAHANFLFGTLSILSPDLYQRLSQWNNPFALVSDKEWAAELYTAWFGPGANPDAPPTWLGPAELAYLRSVGEFDPGK
ncbi:MAG: hypothetical protein R3F60_28715 [bacterium]